MVDARRGTSRIRFVAMAVVFVAGAAIAIALGAGGISVVVGWAAACLTYLVWVWIVVGRFDGDQTRKHANQEDPSRSMSQALLVLASLGSLVVVGVTVVQATHAKGVQAGLLAGLAVASVVLSWFLVHVLFMLRYAVLWYTGDAEGGVDFNQKEPPTYADFAYLAFDLGMTFQVSDTTITSSVIRRVVLRHCLLSYLFGSVILATLINLVAGL